MTEEQASVRDSPKSASSASLDWDGGDSIDHAGTVDCAFKESQSHEVIPSSLQTMLDGLSDPVALFGYDGTIVATNAAWDRGIARRGNPKLRIHGNYLEFVSELAQVNDPGGLALLRGLSEIYAGNRSRFTHLMVGEGSYQGACFKIVL